MSFKDKTFCASPNCQDNCGRKMTYEEKVELEELNDKVIKRMTDAFEGKNKEPIFLTGVSYGYFCGE